MALADADGFTEAFDPKNSSFYVPQSSKTFVPIKNQAFFLGYADNTHLKVASIPRRELSQRLTPRRRASRARTCCSWVSTLPLPSSAASPTATHQVRQSTRGFINDFHLCSPQTSTALTVSLALGFP
jgi:hypothetical protein